jgi:hypothetical protein
MGTQAWPGGRCAAHVARRSRACSQRANDAHQAQIIRRSQHQAAGGRIEAEIAGRQCGAAFPAIQRPGQLGDEQFPRQGRFRPEDRRQVRQRPQADPAGDAAGPAAGRRDRARNVIQLTADPFGRQPGGDQQKPILFTKSHPFVNNR